MPEYIFMDTAFFISLIDNSDNYHNLAKECYQKLIKGNWMIMTSEAVLVELGNGL
jgi:predicted nucleic acid-binding protein